MSLIGRRKLPGRENAVLIGAGKTTGKKVTTKAPKNPAPKPETKPQLTKAFPKLECIDCGKSVQPTSYKDYCDKYFEIWSGCDFCTRATGRSMDLCPGCKFCPKNDNTYCKHHRKQFFGVQLENF